MKRAINPIIRTVVRTRFFLTSRKRALGQAARALDQYLALAEGLSPDAGRQPVEVPPMRGVDEDMRRWSFFMLLEHNVIVNRAVTTTVKQLVCGEPLSGAAVIDPKREVMPSVTAGNEQVQAFVNSVKEHVETVEGLGPLRGTRTTPHPVFGPFDAHRWNCMFSFHLQIHHRQAAYICHHIK